MSENLKAQKLGLRLMFSISMSSNVSEYLDYIDYHKYGLNYNEAKKVVEDVAHHIAENKYKVGETWITIDNDGIKIERK